MSSRKAKHSSANLRGRAREDAQLDRIFRALGDRTRRALLASLARRPAMITELAAPFRMSLPAVSRHIRVLERACLVKRTVDGRVHRCALRAVPLREAEQWLLHYRRFWTGTLDALARYVEEAPDTHDARSPRRH
jgi:DNA-binding transcriptional ArsR family regulator